MVKKCSIEGCEKPSRARGWCDMHYRRWKTHGDPNIVKLACFRTGAASNAWYGDRVSYGGAHQRVRRVRGSASKFSCECGNRADHWAYDHRDPSELIGESRGYSVPYSADPNHYQPMCASCHMKYDLEFNNSQKEVLS